MTSSDAQSAAEIRRIIRLINDGWLGGHIDRIVSLFHEDVVFVLPGLRDHVVGRAACLKSYEDFVANARIHEFSSTEPRVDVWDSTAVAVCPFTMAYEMDGAQHREAGHDVLVFTLQSSGWRIVWRTLISAPAS